MSFVKYTKVNNDNRTTELGLPNSIVYQTTDQLSYILVTFNNNGTDVNITNVRQMEDGSSITSITSTIVMFEVNGILMTKQPGDETVRPLNQETNSNIRTLFEPCNVVYVGKITNVINYLPQSQNSFRSIAQVFFAPDPLPTQQGGRKKRAPSVRRVTKKR